MFIVVRDIESSGAASGANTVLWPCWCRFSASLRVMVVIVIMLFRSRKRSFDDTGIVFIRVQQADQEGMSDW